MKNSIFWISTENVEPPMEQHSKNIEVDAARMRDKDEVLRNQSEMQTAAECCRGNLFINILQSV
jgi:hypothetical protein